MTNILWTFLATQFFELIYHGFTRNLIFFSNEALTGSLYSILDFSVVWESQAKESFVSGQRNPWDSQQ